MFSYCMKSSIVSKVSRKRNFKVMFFFRQENRGIGRNTPQSKWKKEKQTYRTPSMGLKPVTMCNHGGMWVLLPLHQLCTPM